MPEVRTVIDLLRRSAAFLQQKGSPSPRADADFLLAHVLGMERMDLYGQTERPLTPDEVDRYRDLIRRRAGGEPVAYLTGTRGFWTLDLKADRRALIPRPETELIVEQVLAHVGERRDLPWRIVDVGTGSGAIALALASELPHARLLGIDIDAEALALARENAAALGLEDRVRFMHGDLLAPLRDHPRPPHIIVSNPPYVPEGDPRVAADVAAHEPARALWAGADGLTVIRPLLEQTAATLAPGGLLLMEMGAGQGEEVLALARPLFAEAEVLADLAGHDRVLRARREGAHELGEPESCTARGEGTAPAEVPVPDTEEMAQARDTAGIPPELDSAGNLLPVIDLDEM